MNIKIKLFKDGCMPVKAAAGDWYDLVAAEDVWVPANTGNVSSVAKIPLGVAMDIPDDKFAVVAARSSTAPKYGILMAGGIGVIDSAYDGPEDQWFFPAVSILAMGSCIKAGTRIAQFHLFDKQEPIRFEESDLTHNSNRGGFGSTGE